jgi:hypothetical protein
VSRVADAALLRAAADILERGGLRCQAIALRCAADAYPSDAVFGALWNQAFAAVNDLGEDVLFRAMMDSRYPGWDADEQPADAGASPESHAWTESDAIGGAP